MVKANTNVPKAPSPDAASALVISQAVNEWFVREVLPLEAALMHFLRRSWRNKSEIVDLRQDVYVRVYQAATREIPDPVKPFVFAVARNLLIDQIYHDQVVSIDTVSDLDAFNIPQDEPGPDRNAMARQELRILLAAIDRLPERGRDVILMRKSKAYRDPKSQDAWVSEKRPLLSI